MSIRRVIPSATIALVLASLAALIVLPILSPEQELAAPCGRAVLSKLVGLVDGGQSPSADRVVWGAASLGPASWVLAAETPRTASEVQRDGIRRADAELRRANHSSIRGGVLYVPSSFSSADGSYDLFLHYHGNTQVVRESVEVAGLNAVVAVINLGVGSGHYEEQYALVGSYEALLEQIERRLGERKLERPQLRRLALSSWSAGYGAISTILQVRRGEDPLDAVLVHDGIHVRYRQGVPGQLNALPLQAFARLAKRASQDELLFSITHSDIDPRAYAGAEVTAGYLLEQVGGARFPRYPGAARHVVLESAVGAVPKDKEKSMSVVSEARVGSFHVRGYGGETPEHHMAHLLQMAATTLPELTARWR